MSPEELWARSGCDSFVAMVQATELMAPHTSPRTHKTKNTTGLIRFTIQLKFIFSICQTLYHWPGRGLTPAFRTEKSRKLALPVPLPGLQHIARASLEVGQSQSLEVVQQNCRHQKGFCTQVVERPYQKPRRRVGRGLVHQEYVEVRER